ncbi:MAG: hypothetical protein RL011_1401, partial [Pseudomonadota bacterium]
MSTVKQSLAAMCRLKFEGEGMAHPERFERP